MAAEQHDLGSCQVILETVREKVAQDQKCSEMEPPFAPWSFRVLHVPPAFGGAVFQLQPGALAMSVHELECHQ